MATTYKTLEELGFVRQGMHVGDHETGVHKEGDIEIEMISNESYAFERAGTYSVKGDIGFEVHKAIEMRMHENVYGYKWTDYPEEETNG